MEGKQQRQTKMSEIIMYHLPYVNRKPSKQSGDGIYADLKKIGKRDHAYEEGRIPDGGDREEKNVKSLPVG